ncbi:CLIP-associating protein 2-like isoform X2 [Dysidea avara]|uniref:CLIP-associating protein 2-like isoform X2 n=1 Tax=Dysidea avara TaxID=196820 RepID=UPI00332E1B00
MTIIKVLNAYCNEVAEMSRTAEDIFSPLAALVEPHPTLELLGPMLQSEPHPMLLGLIKLLMKVISNCSKDLLQQKVKELSQGLVKAFSHTESAVRKASVFCMVSLHTVMGEEFKPHLSKLSTSQMKLLDLYIKKQAANGHL